MDKYLSWNQLSLVQQLVCVYDTLAKKAITMAIITGYNNRPTQILPCEDVALVIWSSKVMGNISTPLHFHASRQLARNYLRTHTRKKWPSERFDEVDWEHLELALKNKADMFRIWWSKQTSGFCGTRVKVGLYSGEAFPDK
jgi:hypothetical protein